MIKNVFLVVLPANTVQELGNAYNVEKDILSTRILIFVSLKNNKNKFNKIPAKMDIILTQSQLFAKNVKKVVQNAMDGIYANNVNLDFI